MYLESKNPKNNKIISSWNIHSEKEVDSIINRANDAYVEWRDTQLSFRLNL